MSGVFRYFGLGGEQGNCSEDSLGAGLLLGRTSRDPQLFLLSETQLELDEDWKRCKINKMEIYGVKLVSDRGKAEQ